MPSPSSPPPAAGAPSAGRSPGQRQDRKPIPAEFSFLLIAIALLVMLLLAGVPGRTRRAGDGSESLRHGWAAAHAAEVAAMQGAEQAGAQLPTDAGLDRAEAQR